MAKRRSKGEGSIFQRSNGLWVAQINLPSGKRKVKYSRNQKAVREWLLSQRDALKRGMLVEADKITVSDFIDRYMSDVAAHTLRPKTFESYEYIVRLHIKPEIGNVRLSQLKPDQLQALYTLKLNQGLSRRTVQYIHAVLHRSLKQALRWGLVSRNVADLVEAPTVKRVSPRTLTVDEIKKFLEEVKNDRLYPLYVLAFTGMREGELLGLMWEDIDFFSKTIHVRHAVTQLAGKGLVITEPKSDKSKRAIAIPDFMIDVLWDYREKTGKEGLVFHTSTDKPISPRNLTRHFKTHLKKAGLPDIRFHDLRHTTATLLLSEGVHPKVVQEMLGHSQINLTLDTYSHVLPDIQREAAEKMNDILK